jgi:predicted TIM-barrel fold metal-dependent hydrolase
MRSRAKSFDKLRSFCAETPIVDCHDHTGACEPKYADPIVALKSGYFNSDIWSASSDAEMGIMDDLSLSFDERWAVFEKAWRRTCHTGYAQVTRRVLKKFYDIDDLTRETALSMQDRLLDLTDPAAFEAILEEAKIAVRLENLSIDPATVLDASATLSPRARLVIGLPDYHNIRDHGAVQARVAPLKRKVTSLDEYLVACREIFEGYKRFGAVAFKDQSAYSRSIDYGCPARAEAEAVFNWFMADPRRSASYPDGSRPLDDYLFHEFMRMARDMDLPVQIHTGHMAGIRNDIAKTNAVGLTSVIELHQDVRFDLFHANWPYGDELMFLGKNYPNVSIDFCWANIIDPIYCQRLFQQALSAMPHGKVHGYGSDFGGCADRAWAHAEIARDNIAIALSELVDADYLGLDDAREVARAWLFGNANEFFALGL